MTSQTDSPAHRAANRERAYLRPEHPASMDLHWRRHIDLCRVASAVCPA